MIGTNKRFSGVRVFRVGLLACALLAASSSWAAPKTSFPEPLPVEQVPNVATLPQPYPDSWVILHDFFFNSIVDGRAIIVDTESPTNNYKGMLPVAHMGNVQISPKNGEIYVAETYYPRLDRGTRTDVLSIWDMETLASKGEIVLPGGKRQQSVTNTANFQLLNDGKWAAVYDFTPAQSVMVVDLAGRKILSEIDTPGCTSIYPMSGRRFATLCSDGSIETLSLDEVGKLASSSSSEPFNNIDDDPMFMMPAMIGKTAWFVTFLGNVKAIDLSGDEARLASSYSLVDGGNEKHGWRPTGWQIVASDHNGLLYVLMNPDGEEGAHKSPSSEVWVFDTKTGMKVSSFKLAAPSISVAATGQADPRLIVARADGQIDVYDPKTGQVLRTLGASIAFNPMIIMPVLP